MNDEGQILGLVYKRQGEGKTMIGLKSNDREPV